MIRNFLVLVLVAIAQLSCKKDASNGGGTYVVSAEKMIGITSNDWQTTEPQLSGKKGYQYTKFADNVPSVLKAEVHLPAIDDSNRAVKGNILLNITPDNRVTYASFETEPLSKVIAYAMMLNYNRETLQSVSAITSSSGQFVENGSGGNTTVSAILSKISNGQEADQLAITYTSGQGYFVMVVFRQNDGRYIFNYRGIR